MDTKLSDRIVETMPWLDEIANVWHSAFEPIAGATAPRGLKDALVGTWLGHPLHPALVAIPIGAWTSTAALDLVGEERAADLTLGIGLLGALASAATGGAQWQDTVKRDQPRRLGALHATLNIAATALYASSLLLRRRGERRAGIALAMTGYAIVNVAGWLGGDLAYVLGIGVDHTAFEPRPADWVDVLAERELEAGVPKRVDAKGMSVMLYRRDGEITAIGATCSHLGGPLDEGKIEGETVTCPWHGSVFCLRDGSLIHGPATMPAPSFEVRVQGGRIAVRAAS